MTPAPLTFTVLGSGGPVASPHRASPAYLVEAAAGAAVLVDAGGGALERLGRHGSDPAEIAAILLTRLDAGHSGGLASVLLAAYAAGRHDGMLVMGPAGRPGATGTCRFIDLLFGEHGAWRGIRAHPGFGLDSVECPVRPGAAVCAPRQVAGVAVRSAPAPNGSPAVAYRIEHAGGSVVVGGDVDGDATVLAELAAGCDVLVCGISSPDEVGRVAAAARCGLLVLSHVSPGDEERLADALARLRRRHDGPVAVAEDLMTLRVGGTSRRAGAEPPGVTGVPA